MKKYFIFEWNNPIGVKGNPYMYRWRLDFYFFSIRLHKWICSDDLRAYHSHPVNIISFILWGSYYDWGPIKEYSDNKNRCRSFHQAPSINCIKRETIHNVEICQSPTWTLLFTWGAPQKWAFWDKITMKRKNRDKYFLENKHHIC